MSISPSHRARGARWRPLAAMLILGASLAAASWLAPPVEAAPSAAPHSFADPIFSMDARGDITTVGNVTTTCDPAYANEHWTAAESAASCNGARAGATGLARFDGAPMPPINNRLSMEPVDVDGDPATFSSSTAELHIPAGSTVLWAGLHWNAATDVPASEEHYGSSYETAPPNVADRFRVRFSTPAGGGYRTLDAAPADGTTRDTWDDTNPGGTDSYGAYVDVTALVKAGGAGRYGVADVQACRGFGGCFGSWSLTVAFANRSLPARNLNVWHGWQVTSPDRNGGTQEFAVSGITPPPHGKVNARIGVVQADGDRGLGPDSLEISSPSHPAWSTFAVADRPLAAGETDWFNSTVNSFGTRRPGTGANPNHLGNLNQDIALVQNDQIIGNDDHSVRFKVRTASTESLYSQVVHSAVDLYEPEIAIDKTVDPPGPVPAGSEVTWKLAIANKGIDPARRAVVTDPLPDGVTYVAGSVRYHSGGPTGLLGTKTDAPGDDQVDWNATTRTLTLRVGAGADGVKGGTMGTAPAADGSHQLVVTFRTRVDGPPDRTVTNTARAHGEGRELGDPYGPLVTDAEDPAAIAAAPEIDLGITKVDDGAVVRAVGDRYTYRLTATNAGPSPATGVVIRDGLDARIRFVSSADGCTAADQLVTCPVGVLAPKAKATRTFVVEVLELPGTGNVIPNTAIIDGEQPDPDCTEETPDALCNHDDEETPQPSIDLGITKSDDDAEVHAVGDEYEYRLEVVNAGPDDATGVAVTDELHPMLAFVSSESCTAKGQVVTCPIGDLAAGQTVKVALRVRVVALPPAGETILNTAEVEAREPDPDCTDDNPKARCNHDDEETPRHDDPPPTTTTAASPKAPPRGPSGPLPRTGFGAAGLIMAGTIVLASGAAVLAGRRRFAR
ncbi:MAG: hypothetical protein JWO77_3067 [Ilumatobacteraceae bacterium]|nr:hypothetical protein [Ilumatobacteraceae bacterium]